jgi:hypothetical protein
VVETGLKNAAVEDAGAQKKRQENDTLSESSELEKILEKEPEQTFSRNRGKPIHMVKWPLWMASGDYILLLAGIAVVGGGDPTAYRETMHSVQEKWVIVKKEEMDALVDKETWELADCPKKVKVINR